MKHTLTALAGAFVFSANSYAIPEIVITSSRVEQDLSDAITTTDIINRDDIAESQSYSISEILRHSAGFDINANGGRRHLSSNFLRGVANKQMLVMIDGVRVSSASDGFFRWEALDPDIIDRIEVTRGARSSLYGSEAIGGVVQIFTRKQNGYSIKLGGGSYNTQRGSLSMGKSTAKYGINFSLASEQTDGFSATSTNNLYTFNADDDQSKNLNGNLNAWGKIGDKLIVRVNHVQSQTKADFDEGSDYVSGNEITGSEFDMDIQTSSLLLEHRINTRWKHTLSLAHTQNEYKQRNDNDAAGAYNYSNETKRNQASWVHELALGKSTLRKSTLRKSTLRKSTLLLGADYYNEDIDYLSQYGSFIDKEIDNTALFINLQSNTRAFKYGIGFRNDAHKLFGNHLTWNVDAGYQLRKRWLAYANVGTAFRAPTALELFYPSSGNEALTPEEGRTAEAGLKYFGSKGAMAQISIFDTKIDEMIDFDTATYAYTNISEAKIRGVELSWNKPLGNFVFGGALSLLDTKDTNGDKLLRRPDEKLALSLTRYFKKGHVKLNSLSVGTRMDRMDAGNINLPGYTVVNLSGKYQITPKIATLLKVENLADRNYETISGYTTSERAYYLTLEYNGNW
jgi:vitamin B12 transporter